MKRNSDDCRSHCPINFAVETFGDKWTLLVIRDLMFKGKKRYGDFLKSEEGVATNILANRLQRLERQGIVDRTLDADNDAKPIYRLTAAGKDMLPLMLEMTAWSARHDSKSNVPADFLDQFESNRRAVLDQLRAALDDSP